METLTALLVGLSLLHSSPTLAETIPIFEAPQAVLSPSESVEDKIIRYSVDYGVNPNLMLLVSKCERDPIDTEKVNVNHNGTTDHGAFQINSLWKEEAKKQGLDITKQDDNIIFAIKLYKSNGLQPWSASASCRAKHLISDS